MILLVLGIAIFFLIHLVPSLVSLRQFLINKLGPMAYKGIFALIAAVGLGLMIVGKINAEFVALWVLPAWTRYLTIILVLLGFILIPAAYLPSNIKRFTRHPMLWGIALWGTGHLLANGDLSSLLLFGSFVVFALFNMLSANIRGASLQQHSVAIKHDMVVLFAGLGAFILFFLLHPILFNVRIL